MSQLVNEIMTSAGGGQYGNGYDDDMRDVIYSAVYDATMAAMRNGGGTKVEVTLEGDAGKFFNYWQKEYRDRAGRTQKNLIPIFSR